MNMRPLVVGLVVALGIAEFALSALSLNAQQIEIMPPTTRLEIRPDQDERRGSEESRVTNPGLNEPRFISPLSVKTDTGRLGIAGWTSGDPNVPAGRSLSGERGGSVGLGLAAEWSARSTREKRLVR